MLRPIFIATLALCGAARAQHAWYPGAVSETVAGDGLAALDFDGDGRLDLCVGETKQVPGQLGAIRIFAIADDGTAGATPLATLTMASEWARDLTAVDWNGDGRLDLLVDDPTLGCTVYPGLASGFGPPQWVGGAGDAGVAIGDADLDGAPDLVQIGAGASSFRVSLNDGSGGIAASTVSASPFLRRAVFADLDHDGVPDVVTANEESAGGPVPDRVIGRLALGPNATYAAAAASTFTYASTDVFDVTAGDLDLDGDGDVVAAFGSKVAVLPSTGAAFAAPKLLDAAAPTTNALSIGDVDGNVWPDVIAVERSFGSFSLLHDVGAPGAGGAKERVSAGNNPRRALCDDFNGDGNADLAVTGEAPDLAVWVGRGAGDLGIPVGFAVNPIGQSPKCLASADFNGDGRLDLVVGATNFGSSRIEFRFGDGAGGFSPAIGLATSNVPLQVCADDLDGDGDVDVVWRCNTTPYLRCALNAGSGFFGAEQALPLPVLSGSPFDLDVGDIDGDGDGDIVMCQSNDSGGHVRIVRNDGLPAYTELAPVTFLQLQKLLAAGLADLDGDGDLDVVLAKTPISSTFAEIVRIANLGASGFAVAPGSVPCGGSMQGTFAVRDLDGDGRVDVALCRHGQFPQAYLAVLRGMPPAAPGALATFASPVEVPVPWDYVGIVSDDFDCDGRPDLGLWDNSSDTFALHRQTDGLAFVPSSRHLGLPTPAQIITARLHDAGGTDIIVAAGGLSSSTPLGVFSPRNYGFVDSYGSGCAGAGGFVPVLSATTTAVPGTTMSLSLDHALGGGIALLLFGAGHASVPIGYGCKLLVGPPLPLVISVPLPGSGPGTGTLQISATMPASLAGACISMQAVILEASPKLSATNGLTLHVK